MVDPAEPSSFDFWTSVVSDEKYLSFVEKNSVDLKVDIYNALSKIKVDFFYGGCGDAIRSPSWLKIVEEDQDRAKIIWEPLVGLDSYMLKMETEGEDELPLIPIENDESSYLIQDLKPGSQFDISLSAVKKIENVPARVTAGLRWFHGSWILGHRLC